MQKQDIIQSRPCTGFSSLKQEQNEVMACDLVIYNESHNRTLERLVNNLWQAGSFSEVRKSAMWHFQQCSSCTGHLSDNLLAV